MTLPSDFDHLRLLLEPQVSRWLEAHLRKEALLHSDPFSRFQWLDDLRKFLEEVRKDQVDSLRIYHDEFTNGFAHRFDIKKKDDYSRASTATCVASLVATGKWQAGPWYKKTVFLAETMLHKKWESAGLKVDNPFTVAFILEACHVLISSKPDSSFWSEGINAAKRQEAIEILQRELMGRQYGPEGSISIDPYPPSAYLTQLVVRTLARLEALTDSIRESTRVWAWNEIRSHLVLIDAGSKNADYFQLAYSIILVSMLAKEELADPDRKLVLHSALDRFFDGQLRDGTWPRSRPLFHYPDVGNAYCFEYELLVQLIQVLMQRRELRDRLLFHLPKLDQAARALTNTRFELGEKGWGWSSGHHPQVNGPESWSTASVYHFAHQLDRLVAEAIRSEIFKYFDAQYVGTVVVSRDSKLTEDRFAPGFLDCPLTVNGDELGIKVALYKNFVKPISSDVENVRNGGALSPRTPMSAIFFGPPGTSKTDLARRISDFLGWPLLSIDPSHLIRNGIDRVQSEADRLFRMLSAADQLVVLLDEFDEMVRNRSNAPDVLSRFLTTAMLPKLAELNKRKRIVFIVATNYIDQFDLAISRQGRFDMLLQVMPPTLEAKLGHNFGESLKLSDVLSRWKLDQDDSWKDMIQQLTYGECEHLIRDLIGQSEAASPEAVMKIIQNEYQACTLKSPMNPQDQGVRLGRIIARTRLLGYVSHRCCVGATQIPEKSADVVSLLGCRDDVLGRLMAGLSGVQGSGCDTEEDQFAQLTMIVLGQQISMRAACTIMRRLLVHLSGASGLVRALVCSDVSALRVIGIPARKAVTLLALAGMVEAGALPLSLMSDWSDAQVIATLVQIPGLGPWSAEMFLIFGLGRLDVLPKRDLGLRMALQRAYGLDTLPSAERVSEIADRWRPYRSIGVRYCWQSLGNGSLSWHDMSKSLHR